MGSMLEAWQAGVAFVSQELNLFPPLSVAENLWLVPGRTGLTPTREFLTAARVQTERLGLKVPLSTPLASLSLADHQLVEIARALLQQPRVLILDEPTSALHASEVGRLHEILRGLRESGVAMIYISHFLEEVLEIADNVVVIRDGMNVPLESRGKQPTIPEIVTAMLGRASDAVHEPPARKTNTAANGVRELGIENLRAPGLSIDSLVATQGEVVGLAGLAGSGVETVFEILFGVATPASGVIRLPSGARQAQNRPQAVASGVAYFPSDRKHLGLTLDQSIHENVSAVRSLSLGRDGPVPKVARQRQIAEERCAQIGVKMQSVDQPVSSLSGGNQQKVVFARWLEANPSLLLLDDPMRGVDINAKQEMYRIIRDLAEGDRVILFYSTDPGDYVATTDRVLIFNDGGIIDELSGERLNEHELVASMNGETAQTAQAAARGTAAETIGRKA
jgi:ribose transport system ATP-binding protein